MNIDEKIAAYVQQKAFHERQAIALDGAAQALRELLAEEAAEAAEPADDEGATEDEEEDAE